MSEIFSEAKRRSRARTVLAAFLCGDCRIADGDGIDVAVLDGLLPLPCVVQDEQAGEDGASYGYGVEEEVYDGKEKEDDVVEVECDGSRRWTEARSGSLRGSTRRRGCNRGASSSPAGSMDDSVCISPSSW
ncbi:hypothetical protein ZWY2020_023907 [Hordeum vulgare]|nr:hypothetical protein ZWY2020_023907 [Hordeum vulgare]